MGKHETLPFKMTVERGKLVPATPHDAERLDTWRNGTPVNVTFIRDGGRVMERKWWAILNRAVKECKTPWKTAAEASEAIKLAIGVVNLTKTVGGEFMAYPKSLTELDDPDLDEAVQQMIDVVHHVTGVDPEEWKKQVAHIRDDQWSERPPSDEGSGEASPSPSPAADLSPGDEPGTEEGAPELSEPEKQSDGQAAAPSSEQDREWLLSVAKQLWAATGIGEQELVAGVADDLRSQAPESISQAARAKALSIVKQCKLVCFGEQEAADTLEIVAGIAGVETKVVVEINAPRHAEVAARSS